MNAPIPLHRDTPLSAAPPAVLRASRVPVRPKDRVGDAMAAVLRSCLTQLVANRAAAIDGRDVEGVHQMRIAIRRARAAVATFAPAIPAPSRQWLTAELRWLGVETGRVRDLDVAATTLLPPVRAAFPDEPALRDLETALEVERGEAYALLRESLRAQRYTRFVLNAGTWIEAAGWREHAGDGARALHGRTIGAYAPSALAHHEKRVRKRGKGFDRLEPVARHRFRLALKRLRYSGEFLAPLYPDRRVGPYLRAIARLQDALGAFNDASQSAAILAETHRHLLDGQNLAGAAGMVAAWHAQAALAAEPALGRAWRRFRKETPFWKR